jgi:hypothetical protein
MPPDSEGWTHVPLFQFLYSTGGLIVGIICVLGGIVLFLHGVVGSTTWIGSFIGVKSQLADAAPGTILFVVGLFVIWVTRFDISPVGRATRKQGKSQGKKPKTQKTQKN